MHTLYITKVTYITNIYIKTKIKLVKTTYWYNYFTISFKIIT